MLPPRRNALKRSSRSAKNCILLSFYEPINIWMSATLTWQKIETKNWKQSLLKHYMLTAWLVSLSVICWSVCSPVHMSICPSAWLFICLSFRLSILSLYIICSQLGQSLCLFSVTLSVHLFVCPSARLSVCLSSCQSVYLMPRRLSVCLC